MVRILSLIRRASSWDSRARIRSYYKPAQLFARSLLAFHRLSVLKLPLENKRSRLRRGPSHHQQVNAKSKRKGGQG